MSFLLRGRTLGLATFLLVAFGACGGSASIATPSAAPPSSPMASATASTGGPASPTAPIVSTAPSASPTEPGGSAGEPSTSPSQGSALTTVTEDSGAISIAVPASWIALDRRWFAGDEDRGPALVASPNAAAFAEAFDGRGGNRSTWGIEGVFVGVSRSLADKLKMGDRYVTAITALAKWHGGAEETERAWAASCLRVGASVYDFDNGALGGFATRWRDCGSIGTLVLDLGATGSRGGYVVQVIVVMPEGDAASGLASDILSSLTVAPDAVP